MGDVGRRAKRCENDSGARVERTEKGWRDLGRMGHGSLGNRVNHGDEGGRAIGCAEGRRREGGRCGIEDRGRWCGGTDEGGKAPIAQGAETKWNHGRDFVCVSGSALFCRKMKQKEKTNNASEYPRF